MSEKTLKSNSTYNNSTTTGNKYETLINNLKVSEEAKSILRRVKKIAASSNGKVKASVKDLFVVSPSCKELSKYARCYEQIIMGHGVYKIRGAATYMELAFPQGNKEDYQKFFASPRIVASTQNYFTGVFLISFEQWTSSRDLLSEEGFRHLLQFVDDNKHRISFVFHVRPEFGGCSQLVQALKRHVNLLETKISYPDLDVAADYVAKQLKESGMKLSAKAKTELKKLIDEKVDMNSPAYSGYTTLEMLVEDIRFELYDSITTREEVDCKETCKTVCDKNVRLVAESIDVSVEEPVIRRLGFQQEVLG